MSLSLLIQLTAQSACCLGERRSPAGRRACSPCSGCCWGGPSPRTPHWGTCSRRTAPPGASGRTATCWTSSPGTTHCRNTWADHHIIISVWSLNQCHHYVSVIIMSVWSLCQCHYFISAISSVSSVSFVGLSFKSVSILTKSGHFLPHLHFSDY